MQRIILFPLLVLFLFFNYSCSRDFLETPPGSSAEQKTFITNLESCEQLLNGSYRTALDVFYWGLNLIYVDLIADNVKPVGFADLPNQYSWSQIPSESATGNNMNEYWNGYYKVIRTLAFVLENIDRFTNENPGKANDIKGQALALRAWMHFDLVNRFAQPYKFTQDASHPGVPYIKVSDYNISVRRNTVAEVYQNMIEDLDKAILLLGNSSSKEYIGREAAMALLSRVYLYQGDYIQAGALAVAVSKAIPIMKNGYPEQLFTENETEAIFHFAPTKEPVYTRFTGNFYAGNRLSFVATNDIAEILNENPADARSKWIIDHDGSWKVIKFPQGAVSGVPDPSGAHYQTIFRSSEMYLTAAECYAETGKRDSAIYYLDEIRLRADPVAAPTTSDGEALVNAILKERRKELAFEGHRFFDILRRGYDVIRTDVVNSAQSRLHYGDAKAIAPIPLLEVNLNHIPQNENY